MSKILGALWRVEWGNPYTDPPEGERILIEVYRPVGHAECHRCPEEIRAIKSQVGFGSGYFVTWRGIKNPPKPRSKETLASIRRKRLERRMRNKFPLLADEFIEDKLRSNPDYYAGETDPKLEATRQATIQHWQEEVERITKMET